MWIPFFTPTLLEIEGGKSFRPRQCTNWSILLQRCCRHLQSTSKKGRGRFKWYIEVLFHPQIHRLTVLDLCYTLAHLHVLPESDFRRYFILDKAKRTLQKKKNAHWGIKKLTSQTDAGRWSQTSLFHYTAPPVRITWYTCEDSLDRTKKKKIKSRFKILLPWACRAPCADSGSGFYKHPSPGQESPPEPGWLVGLM